MTLEQAVKDYSMDNRYYPDVFPLNAGNDLKLSDRPEITVDDKGSDRCVRINIISFIGSCVWAKHYYADIDADGCDVGYNDENGTRYSIMGFISTEYKQKVKENPLYEQTYKITVIRPSNERDVKEAPYDFYPEEIGKQHTSQFYSKEEAIQTAKEVVSFRFPGWKVEVNDRT